MEYSEAEVRDGKLVLTETRQIEPRRCPHFILVGDHYRADGSCKCDDPGAKEMREWGYKWSRKSKSWVSP